MRHDADERGHPGMDVALCAHHDLLLVEGLDEAHVLRRHHVVEGGILLGDRAHVVQDGIAVEEDHLLPDLRADDVR
jgi:hypothetical protein